MRVFNEDKTIELTEYDLDMGHLENSELTIHHEAVSHVQEQGHWITVAEYPNGGKDVQWVVDVKGVEGHDAYDETESILVYIPFTASELRKRALMREQDECREWLEAHDYIGVKIATGRATIEEYADIIAQMTVKADRINEINALLKGYEND